MTNEEITAYLHEWRNSMSSAISKDSQIMGAVIGITVMLSEIAKRMPEQQPAKGEAK